MLRWRNWLPNKAAFGEMLLDFCVDTWDHGSGDFIAIRPFSKLVEITPNGHRGGTVVKPPEETIDSFIRDTETVDGI